MMPGNYVVQQNSVYIVYSVNAWNELIEASAPPQTKMYFTWLRKQT